MDLIVKKIVLSVEEGIWSVCVEVEGLRVTMARAPYCTVLVETLQ